MTLRGPTGIYPYYSVLDFAQLVKPNRSSINLTLANEPASHC